MRNLGFVVLFGLIFLTSCKPKGKLVGRVEVASRCECEEREVLTGELNGVLTLLATKRKSTDNWDMVWQAEEEEEELSPLYLKGATVLVVSNFYSEGIGFFKNAHLSHDCGKTWESISFSDLWREFESVKKISIHQDDVLSIELFSAIENKSFYFDKEGKKIKDFIPGDAGLLIYSPAERENSFSCLTGKGAVIEDLRIKN